MPEQDVTPASGPPRHLACGGGLTVALHDIDGVLVLGLYGPVGPTSRSGLQAALHAVFSSQPSRIAIDASCITDCDRRGLCTFIDAAERARDSGIPFAVSGLARRYVQLIQILWRPHITDPLSHLDLQQALTEVTGQLSRNDRTREELLNDVDELHQALLDNRIVEQATGILMAIYGFGADAAMALLRCHAEAQNEKASVLASRLTNSVQRGDAGLATSSLIDALLDDIAHPGELVARRQPPTSVRSVAPSTATVS